MGETVIKVENVTKRYNIYRKNIHKIMGVFFGRKPDEVKYALRDVSLEVEKGDRVLIAGRSESGRSSLMKIAAGIVSPSKGSAFATGSMNILISIKAGYDYEYTCRENMYLKANLLGIPASVIKEHEQEIIEFAGVEKYADLPLKRASKGTAERIAVAIHTLMKCDILFIDDTFTAGGAKSRLKCESRLKEYFEANPEMTVVMTANVLLFAERMCNRGIILENGEVIFAGTGKETCVRFRQIKQAARNNMGDQDFREAADSFRK